MLYEFGTPEVGLAAAGWAARAQDPSTIATNPAGMTRLADDQFMMGVQALYADLEFSTNTNTTNTGGGGGNPVEWFPGGSAFGVHSISPDWKLGLGLYGNFGSTLDYDDDWAGRYFVQDTTLIGFTISPALAYRVNDKFSVGVALNAMYGVFKYDVAVNNQSPLAGDGKMEIEDEEWGYGASVGVLFSPAPGTRLGLTYTSKVDLDFSDEPKFKNLAPVFDSLLGDIRELDLSMTVPQTVMASFYHELNPRWALLGNLGWQDWSEFGKVGVEVTSTTSRDVTADRNYEDTWHVALGAQYRLSDPWLLSFGMAYDSSAVEDEDRTADVPMGEAWHFSFGGQYKWKKNLDVGLAYTFIWAGDMDLDQERPLPGRLAGSYEDTNFHFFATHLRWRF
jgi:long-chain fatty acid transport protein